MIGNESRKGMISESLIFPKSNRNMQIRLGKRGRLSKPRDLNKWIRRNKRRDNCTSDTHM